MTPLIAIVGVVIAVVRAGRKATVGYSAVSSTPLQPRRLLSSGSSAFARTLTGGRNTARAARRVAVCRVGGVFLGIAIKLPPAPIWLRILLYAVTALMLWVITQAWGGFRYRVTSTGVEVRTGGIRVCTIPKARSRITASRRSIRWAILAVGAFACCREAGLHLARA